MKSALSCQLVLNKLDFAFCMGPFGAIFNVPNMRDRTILIDGFSKTYCMTGWRLGWAVMPAHLARRVELLLVHSIGCTATFTQLAGISALEVRQVTQPSTRPRFCPHENLFKTLLLFTNRL